MKNFFKSMWYGVKASYKENRRLILMLISAFGSFGISAGIGKLISDNDGISLLIAIIGLILGIFLIIHYLHFQDANEYSKKHNVSFEIAWENTKPSGDDCF